MLSIAFLLAFSAAAQAGGAQAPCAGPEYRLLDFWTGRWDVKLSPPEGQAQAGSAKTLGTNIIEKTLGGCAVLEHWSDAAGGSGKSLFYYHPAERVWKQVWVTDIGRVKEKRAVAAPSPDAVRFQGELRADDGSRILDRTTLTRLPGGRVRQLIEQSVDDGRAWKPTFDAIYTPMK